MNIRRIKRKENDNQVNISPEDNMYTEFEKKTIDPSEFGLNTNNNQSTTNNVDNKPETNNNNNLTSFVDENGYHEKQYKTGTLEENTVVTTASKVSRIFLYGFYLLFIGIGVLVFFMLRANKYEFYLKNDEVSIFKGSTYQVELIPKYAKYFDYLNYNYSTSDSNVATVDEFGTVTAVGSGTTYLKISLSPGFTSKTMKIHAEDIEINSIDLRVYADEKLKPSGPITMNTSQSLSLRAVVNNREDLNATVTYTSSNPSVASVDEFGNITGKSVGTAVITGTSGSVSGSVTVTVKQSSTPGTVPTPTTTPKEIQSLSFTSSSLTLKNGSSVQLPVIVTPKELSGSAFTWSSSDNNIVTVDNNGLIKGISNGTATITVTSSNGKTTTCNITITNEDIKVNKITINTTKTSINVGNTYQLLTSISPSNATERSLTWSSSDNNIVTVSNGLIKGIKAGTAVITVKSSDGKVSATCQVTVKTAPVVTPTVKPTVVPTTPPGVKVTKVSLGITQTTKYVNDTLQLSTTVEPSSVTSYKAQWSSSNNDVATVSSNGLVTTKKTGTAVITATVDGVSASCTIIVRERTTPVTPTTAPTTKPTQAPSSAEFTFDKKYVGISTQNVTVNKGSTTTVKLKMYNAAGLFDIKSSNGNIVKFKTKDKNGNLVEVTDTTLWLDGVDEDFGEPFWAEKELTILGVNTGTTTIIITDDPVGISTYDTSVELKGKIVINVQVK